MKSYSRYSLPPDVAFQGLTLQAFFKPWVLFIVFVSLFLTQALQAEEARKGSNKELSNNSGKHNVSFKDADGLSEPIPKSFDASYKLYYKWMKMGEGHYKFYQPDESDASIYRFAFNSKMRFLFFSDKRQVSSDFTIDKGLLFPLSYSHEREGSGDDYSEQVVFDWNKRSVNAAFRKKQYQLDLNSNESPIEGQAALNTYHHVLDGLAVQFQLFLDVRKAPQTAFFIYPIIEPYGLMERKFNYEGQEKIELEVNNEDLLLDCAVFSVERKQKKFKTLMYFAKNFDYLPVQLVHYANDKKQFSAILSEFNAAKK